MAKADGAELVFVVDVTSFTEKGFIASTSYEGKGLDLEFDEENEGVFLEPEMAKRLGVRRGASLSIIVEDTATTVTQVRVSSVGSRVRISDARVYYAIGREGGAVIRIRRP